MQNACVCLSVCLSVGVNVIRAHGPHGTFRRGVLIFYFSFSFFSAADVYMLALVHGQHIHIHTHDHTPMVPFLSPRHLSFFQRKKTIIKGDTSLCELLCQDVYLSLSLSLSLTSLLLFAVQKQFVCLFVDCFVCFVFRTVAGCMDDRSHLFLFFTLFIPFCSLNDRHLFHLFLPRYIPSFSHNNKITMPLSPFLLAFPPLCNITPPPPLSLRRRLETRRKKRHCERDKEKHYKQEKKQLKHDAKGG
ncbi:MAG: hypothetical protein J3R72DRAFT_206699 [Linnemannia gamsii]|nr:MAG: hypothetical protein J3R72DRAFT_206699 [Linnemannia gamsii]